jgi:hypothetical protein
MSTKLHSAPNSRGAELISTAAGTPCVRPANRIAPTFPAARATDFDWCAAVAGSLESPQTKTNQLAETIPAVHADRTVTLDLNRRPKYEFDQFRAAMLQWAPGRI